MRIFAICFFALIGMVNSSQGALVFSMVQQVAGPITQGNTAVFDIFVADNSATPVLGGVDFTVTIASPNGGVFSAGSVPATFRGGATVFSGGWIDPFPLSSNAGFSLSVNNGPGLFTMNTSPALLATVSVSTVGSLVGDYDLTLTPDPDGLLDIGFNPLTSSASSYITSYSISAVPEPTSIALVSLIGGAVGVRFWRKKRAAAV
jgi:hypothetical protein